MDVLPEWTQAAPEGWERTLRTLSPIAERTSYLHFRWREREGRWTLYELTPKALLTPERVQQLTVHWSDLPPSQQHARRRFVSEYQHYMFRTHGVEARLHWILQGEMGGTPAIYTRREEKLLDAVGAPSEPPEIDALEPCPFDLRAVNAIGARDRLLKVGGDLEALLKTNDPKAVTAEDAEADIQFRKDYLKWWFVQMIPNSEFMKSYLRTEEASRTMRKATKAEANAATEFADYFIEHGTVPGPANVQTSIHSVVPSTYQVA
jgi:hypothetical protein